MSRIIVRLEIGQRGLCHALEQNVEHWTFDDCEQLFRLPLCRIAKRVAQGR